MTYHEKIQEECRRVKEENAINMIKEVFPLRTIAKITRLAEKYVRFLAQRNNLAIVEELPAEYA